MLLCAVPGPAIAAAQEPAVATDRNYIIDKWETEDGLPENSATAMVQTPDGYLWFGTFNGLVRFDGVTFTVFDPSNAPELPSASIDNLHLDAAGRIWVSTQEGVARSSAGVWRRFGREEGWVGKSVRTFAERANGDLLMTTFDGKVLEFSAERLHELPAPPGKAGEGYTAHADPGGEWCVVQNHFVGRWDGQRWIETQPASELQAARVCSAPARDGGVWILSGTELRKYRGAELLERRTLPVLAGGLWSLHEDSRANVWICTYDRGLCRITADGEFSRWDTSNGLTYDATRFAFEDREGNLWVGTSGGGLLRFKPRRFTVHGIEQGLSERVIRSVSPAPDGGVWIATFGGGLFRQRTDTLSSVSLPGWEGRKIYVQSVLADRSGRTWVGTMGRGLWRIDDSGARQVPAAQSGGADIAALFEDSRGRLWTSGGEAVAACDGERFQLYGFEPQQAHASADCFAEDDHGAVWLSTLAGVFRLEHERFVEVRDEAGGSILDITYLAGDADGTLWMGSRTSGLLRWHGGRIERIDARVGFPAKAVYDRVEDDQGHWWIATNVGVVRVRKADLEAAAEGTSARIACQVLDESDGLTSTDCGSEQQPGCARDADGRLWFATLKGVAVIDPAAFRLNDRPPPVCIEQLTFQERAPSAAPPAADLAAPPSVTAVPSPSGEPILCAAGAHEFEIHYTALSFVAPEKVHFQIQLEGQDGGWRDAGTRRRAEYHALKPGDYVFRVRAANNDGVWNETGARLPFTVQPFYWQTWWFRSGALLALLASTAGSAWWLAQAKQRTRRQLDERSRLLVEAAPNAMVMCDAEGRIVLANAQAERDFGYRHEELLGQAVEMLLPERFRADHPGLRRGYLVQPTARPMGGERELFGRHRSGREFPVEVGLSAIRTAEGLFVLASILDISARKHAELEALRQRNELAHLSRVTMLGELSGSMAHELNQPLTAILSNAQAAQRFLARTPIDLDEVRDILSDIVEQDNRAGEVIRRLRLLLRKGEVQQQPLGLNELVQEVLKLVQSDLVNHGVTAHAELAPALPEVSGDRVQLQQVLLNLVMNACDAMSGNAAAERQLIVRTERSADERVRVSVFDRGTGIPADKLEQVFEPFYTSKVDGLGLGLSVCRSILTAHGGRLWAANNPQRGAVFHFTLPVHAEVEA